MDRDRSLTLELLILGQIWKEVRQIRTTQGGIMATLQDALDKANQLKSQNSDLLVKVSTLENESQNAFNRLDQKIAGSSAQIAALQEQITALQAQVTTLQGQISSGAEAQPVIDVLNSIAQAQSEISPTIDTMTATAKLEGN